MSSHLQARRDALRAVNARTDAMLEPKVGDLRVWHMGQIGTDPFFVPVKFFSEAKLLLDALAAYDMHQLAHNIRPDFSNAQGLEVYEQDAGEGAPGWCDWYDHESGDEIDATPSERISELDMLRSIESMDDKQVVAAFRGAALVGHGTVYSRFNHTPDDSEGGDAD